MIEYFSQHPMQAVKYAVMIVLAIIIFFLYRAVKTGDGKVFGNTKAENALKNEFKIIDENTFKKDDYRLIVGMCMKIQTELEKEKIPNDAFLKLPDVKRNIMTLGYLFEDSQVSVSNFFRSNGEPLLSAAVKAVNEVELEPLTAIIEADFRMFDESNEDVSVDESEVRRLDAEFKAIMDGGRDEIYAKTAEYIRKNKDIFM